MLSSLPQTQFCWAFINQQTEKACLTGIKMNSQVVFTMNISSVRNNLRIAKSDNIFLKRYEKH